ncbi:MAG: sigma-E processing peptidase SpoIIGA [Clostridia bacterium]|nr:sigma-E processing peptidase SpoIIGA [Clostridia bacterium]
MTIYADILVLINTYVNYFVLLATCTFLRTPRRFLRLFLGAAVGGVCSLVILLPQKNELISMLCQLSIAVLIIFITFGFDYLHIFLKRLASFFLVSFLFSGSVYFIYQIFKPNRLIINNSVIYFDISTIELILGSAAIYAVIIVVRTLNGGFAKNDRKKVKMTIEHNGKRVEFSCLIDTGNMLRDAFTDMPVAVVDSSVSRCLMIDLNNLSEDTIKQNKLRYIPYNTVGNEGLMPVFKPDCVLLDGRRVDNLLIGVSSHKFESEYKAVANYDIL